MQFLMFMQNQVEKLAYIMRMKIYVACFRKNFFNLPWNNLNYIFELWLNIMNS